MTGVGKISSGIFFIVLLCLPTRVYAQLWGLGLNGESDFSRQLDAMKWNMNGNYSMTSPDFMINIQNLFNSRLYLLNGQAQNVQDENQADLDLNAWFNKNLGMRSEAHSYTFTTTNVSQNYFLIGPGYRYKNVMWLSPMVGIMSDRRSGHLDEGPMVGLRTHFKELKIGDFLLDPNLLAQYADIKPRSSQTYHAGGQAQYNKYDVSMNANLQVGETKRDSYQPSNFLNQNVNNVIESILSDSTLFSLNMDFPIIRKLRGKIDFYTLTNVRRFINNSLSETTSNDLFDSRFVRQEMNIDFSAKYDLGFGQLKSGMTYSTIGSDSRLINTSGMTPELVQRRQQILQNSGYSQQQFTLYTDNTLNLSDKNKLEAQGQISILRYNTPASNYDDHDELSYLININDEHKFTNYLSGNITLAGEAFHNVFIFAQRSIENHWRRSIRLLPSLTWQPLPFIQVQQQFLIRANYTVFDFQVPGQPDNNQASREYGYNTSVDLQFLPGWSIEAQGSRNELRIGRLYWKQFRELPLDTLTTYQGQFMLAHEKNGNRISAGIRVFLKYDYLPASEIRITVNNNGTSETLTRLAPGKQATLQWGPVIQIRMPMLGGNELDIDGWLQQQNVRKKLYTKYPAIYAADFHKAEKHWATRIFPNISIHARFFF